METSQTLILVLTGLIFFIAILGLIYWYMGLKNKSKKANISNTTNNVTTSKSNENYTKLSVFNFMEFDKIEDNMIIQNGGTRYLMAIECEGINYDLMSEVEKASVEAGFVQFLNTLRYPIQIYTQTRTINISNSIKNYKTKVDEINLQLERKKLEQQKLLKSDYNDENKAKELKYEITRISNMLEYGRDVIANIEKMSQNRNVLRKHYYIVIPYYSAELGETLLDDDEKRNMIFSELYTRCQAVIRTLFACSMRCKMLDSKGLIELLFVAYNREDSEILGVDQALEYESDELYSTAPDVFEKKIKALNNEIEKKAIEKAQEAVDEVISERQRKVVETESNFDKLIKSMAERILKENQIRLGKDVTEEAVKKIAKEDTKEKGDYKNVQKAKKGSKRVTKAS